MQVEELFEYSVYLFRFVGIDEHAAHLAGREVLGDVVYEAFAAVYGGVRLAVLVTLDSHCDNLAHVFLGVSQYRCAEITALVQGHSEVGQVLSALELGIGIYIGDALLLKPPDEKEAVVFEHGR